MGRVSSAVAEECNGGLRSDGAGRFPGSSQVTDRPARPVEPGGPVSFSLSVPPSIFVKYNVSDITIDTGRQQVSRGTESVPLPKLSYDLLLALVRAAPNVVSLDELMRLVWPGIVASPETVSQRVKLLRDALDDDPERHATSGAYVVVAIKSSRQLTSGWRQRPNCLSLRSLHRRPMRWFDAVPGADGLTAAQAKRETCAHRLRWSRRTGIGLCRR